VAAHIHAVDHPAFAADLATIASQAAHRLCHLMIPKVESLADVQQVDAALSAMGGAAATLPIHVLVESARAVHNAFDIAGHPRVQSISFGLMDFVSSHRGAIGSDAMGSSGQFTHPLVVRAKLEISSACHAHGKVPSHCVVTEFSDAVAMERAATRAARELGYTRMWSIHPAQIRPILAAFAPQQAEIETATALMQAAQEADWAPVSFNGQLHDRASYRYYWQLLERAHRTGTRLPAQAQAFFE
jgi:citrate lyase subunit beta/citryl-CoA lyase